MKLNYLLLAFFAITLFSCDDDEPKVALIEDLRMCNIPDGLQCNSNETTFASTDNQITAAVKVKDANANETITFHWTYVSTNEQISSNPLALSQVGSSSNYSAIGTLQPGSGGFLTGNYKVEAVLSSGLSISRTFIVQ